MSAPTAELEGTMEFRHLRYFVAAAEEEHFGRAAERLGISPQALGLQIRELEGQLGVDLFERVPRGVQLTAAGTGFLDDARQLLSKLTDAIGRAQSRGNGKIGTLRVGHLPLLLRSLGIGHVIPIFCVRYPDVDLRSMDLNTVEQCSALNTGRIDVGLTFTPPEVVGIQSEVLHEIPLDGALLPATHPLAQKRPLYCRDLADLPLLVPPASAHPSHREWFRIKLRTRGLDVTCSEDHQVEDLCIRAGLVAAGVGWMAASSSNVQALLSEAPGAVFRQWADAPIPAAACMWWRSSDHSPLVMNFLALCRELLAGKRSLIAS